MTQDIYPSFFLGDYVIYDSMSGNELKCSYSVFLFLEYINDSCISDIQELKKQSKHFLSKPDEIVASLLGTIIISEKSKKKNPIACFDVKGRNV